MGEAEDCCEEINVEGFKDGLVDSRKEWGEDLSGDLNEG